MNRDGYEIFQIDESLFSSQDCKQKSWSLPNKNIQYQHLSRHTGLYSVIAAISSQQEKIYSKYKKGYLNSDETIMFIRFLKRSNAGKKITLFLDNCSIIVQAFTAAQRSKGKQKPVQQACKATRSVRSRGTLVTLLQVGSYSNATMVDT